MADIVVVPATADRFDDAQHALTGGGDGSACQCQWWMVTNADFQRLSREERLERLRAETQSGLPPALIAYVDDEAAGWVRVGPRVSQPRLARTKAIANGMRGLKHDPDTWAITCFVVRKEFRGRGLNSRLIDAAVTFAREGGARAIEGYPIDTTAKKHAVNDLYHGTLSTFQQAGFREVARPRPGRPVVELQLD